MILICSLPIIAILTIWQFIKCSHISHITSSLQQRYFSCYNSILPIFRMGGEWWTMQHCISKSLETTGTPIFYLEGWNALAGICTVYTHLWANVNYFNLLTVSRFLSLENGIAYFFIIVISTFSQIICIPWSNVEGLFHLQGQPS